MDSGELNRLIEGLRVDIKESYDNFETEEDSSKWTYYMWENEDNKVDSDDLMSKAIAECVKMDEERGVEPSLD